MSKEYGFVATQSGANVSKAADYQKLIDSNWNILSVLKKFNGRYSGPAEWNIIGEHNLGYVPAFNFKIYNTKNMVDWDTPLFLADSKYIYCTSGMDMTPWEFNYSINVFNINFSKEYKYKSTTIGNRDISKISKNGIKIINKDSSRNMSSDELSDYSVNSKSKVLPIHMVGSIYQNELATGVGNGPRINHALGYNPSYFVARLYKQSEVPDFDLPGNEETLAFPINKTDFKIRSNENYLWFGGAQSALVGTFGYVIFKDPSELL